MAVKHSKFVFSGINKLFTVSFNVRVNLPNIKLKCNNIYLEHLIDFY